MSGRFDKAHWAQLSPLLDELLALDPALRMQRVAELRRDQHSLADELTDLLAQYTTIERDGFLDDPLPSPVDEPSLTGQTIGSYTVDRLLGEGGMGAVWLAHRSDGRFEAQVAVKLLNPALLGPGGIERFRREGRALGRLTHPNIAHLLDAGVTQAGQPYLVLEYVDGETIHRWCDSHDLDVEARVRLMLDVLAAVAHAHAKLILHRDLKPSNILVNADGQVKLVDFGIAKLLDDAVELAPSADLTRLAGHAFTPDYAAPEQVQAGEVTSATDVYALGVLLYVLLTGEHPTSGGAHTPLDRLRAIVDTEPTRPSDAAGSRAPSTGRGGSPQRARALHGDLDNIVLKALKKQPAERYPTVEGFADDLRRYLSDRPVSAHADSFGYRARKFVTRHKLGVGAAAIVLLTVVVATVVSIRQAIEATRQRDRALSLAARNEAVVGFFSSMLTEVAPADQPVRVADLLDRSRQILMSEEDIPEHRAAILHMLAAYYLSSGKPAQAEELLARSLELTKATSDTELRATLLCESAYAASLLGRPDDAKRMIEQGLTYSGDDSLTTVQCLRNRAYIAQNTNDPKAALEYAQQAQARLKKSPIAKPDLEAELLADIAAAHYLAGRNDAAERYYAESLAKFVAMGRGESPSIFFLRNNWGIASFGSGDPRRALEQYDEALRIAVQRSIGGEPPPYLLINRAFALVALARYDDALAAYDAAIESATRAGNAAVRIAAGAGRANTRLMMGDVDGAERELAPLTPEIGRTVPEDSVPAMTILQVLARVDAERGRLSQSIAGLSKIVAFFDGREMRVGALVRALNARSDVYLRSNDTTSAMADARRSVDIARTLQGGKPYSSLTGQGLLLLARAQELLGQLATSRTLASEAVPHLTQTLGATHPDTLRAARMAASTVTAR